MKERHFGSTCLLFLCLAILTINSCTGPAKIKPAKAGSTPLALKAIKLLPPQTDIGRPLMQVLKDRKTIRNYSDKKISDQDISNILWAAFGINRPESGHRTAPSAVNWQVTDIYVALEEGLFIYDASAHQLNPILSGDIRAEATHYLQPKRDSIVKAPLTLIYVADSAKRGLLRMALSEAEKDFYAAADVGFISQNVYLYCASEGLGTVIRGMLNRDKLHQVMGLREDQKIMLAQSIGHPVMKGPDKSESLLLKIPDGVYYGRSRMTKEEDQGKEIVYEVEVSVEDSRITNIKILEGGDSEYADPAEEIIGRVIQQQSLDVDAVSGATLSSHTLLDAIGKALKKSIKEGP